MWYDLSHRIEQGMPLYPGTPEVKIQEIANCESYGFKESVVSFASHTGTHVDAPSHMLSQGKNLDEFSITQFIGKAFVVPVGEKEIKRSTIEQYESEIKNCDFVFLCTEWDRHWGEPGYYRSFPYLGQDACSYLVSLGVKAIGLDTPSVDAIDSTDYKNHLLCFENEILIFENLTKLADFKKCYLEVFALPLLFSSSDGAPVRVVARKLIE